MSVNTYSVHHTYDNNNSYYGHNYSYDPSLSSPAAAHAVDYTSYYQSQGNTYHSQPQQPHNPSSNFQHTSVDSSAQYASQNPFTPPAMSAKLLKKIQRLEFVDFAELLPNNAVSDSDTTGQPHINVGRHSKTLHLSHGAARKEKLSTFPKWCLAWNNFMQAHLYYHPHDFHNLFSYQKNFCNHANKYHIDACIRYDREFRLTLASEKGLPPHNQTVHWQDTVHQGLFIKHLSGSQITTCNYCYNRGHYEASCPEKRDAEAQDPKHLPSQIASAVQQSLQDFRRNTTTTTTNFGPTGSNTSSVPPKEKFCFRFNQGIPCKQPPCQFAHFCTFCKTLSHPFSQCRKRNTSANFIVPNGGKH